MAQVTVLSCCPAVLTTGDKGARHKRVVRGHLSSLSFLLFRCADHWRYRNKTQGPSLPIVLTVVHWRCQSRMQTCGSRSSHLTDLSVVLRADHWRSRTKTQVCGSGHCPFCCPAVLTTGNAGVGRKRVVQGHHTSLSFLLSCDADHWRCRSKTQACGSGHCPFCCSAVLTTGDAGARHRRVVHAQHSSLSFMLSSCTDHWGCRSKTQVRGSRLFFLAVLSVDQLC